jgi:uncharacterized protein YjbJ (UPF0337 family)
MDKERIKGAAQTIKGSMKKAVGRLLGDKKLETEGKIDEATGNVRKAVGEAKDVVRDVAKDRT